METLGRGGPPPAPMGPAATGVAWERGGLGAALGYELAESNEVGTGQRVDQRG